MNVWNDWNVLNGGNVPNVWNVWNGGNVWNVWNGGNVLPQNVPGRKKRSKRSYRSSRSWTQQKSPRRQKPAEAVGGPGGIRTLDLSDANRTLSQLSYRPLWRAGRADLAVRPCALRLVYYTSFWPKCQADFCGDFLFGLTDAKKRGRLSPSGPACLVGLPACYPIRLFLSRRILSAIMAMNSELVGLPRMLWMVSFYKRRQ